jgi:TM2 domain-containing membrane protein YozV
MGYGPPAVMPGMMGPGMMPGMQQKNPGLAILLELLGGFLFQTFGIGNMYAGNVGVGVGLMLGYWALTAVNFVLCFVFIGFITWPLTWIAFAILSPILANNAAKRANGMAV